MAKLITPLSIAQINAAKPKDKQYKLMDGQGLVLVVLPSGAKKWRFRYRRKDKKEDTISIGEYPAISLAEARLKREEYRALLAKGIDPKKENEEDVFNSFRSIAEQWYARRQKSLAPSYSGRLWKTLDGNVLSKIGKLNISEIKPKDIVAALTPMEERGALELLNRTKQVTRQIFEFAISRGICENNPAASIGHNAFHKHVKKNFRALSPSELPILCKALYDSRLNDITTQCLLFELLTICRPIEAVAAEWPEFNDDVTLWTLPAHRMKKRRIHIVPLATQTQELIKSIKKEEYHDQYVFIGRDGIRHLNEASPRMGLIRLGIDSTAHGLRALASTVLNESGHFRPDVIEMALAHVPKDEVRAAYNRAEYIEERREMLQWWADLIYSHFI